VGVLYKPRGGRIAVYSTVSTCVSSRRDINLNICSASALLYEKDLRYTRYIYLLQNFITVIKVCYYILVKNVLYICIVLICVH
jgi:hypothetical protein